MEVTARHAQELFQFLRPDQVIRLSKVAQPASFKTGETVYERGASATYMYVVVSGRIALLAPGADGVDVLVNELGEGELFGVCVCLGVDSYSVTARCEEDAWLLRMEAAAVKRLIDEDVAIGYGLATQIAKIYFARYIATVRRLTAIITHIPLERT
jgi:thioredoxin reductase (NADPH)